MIIRPRRATWKRWLNLTKSPYSLLRSMEYEVIQGLKLQGKVLDLGGGARSSYISLLSLEMEMISVNIDSSMRPTIFADLNRPLPIASCMFDCVISLNTFEHIYEDELTIKEALRILRSGGKFYFIMPFLLYVHASPADYHRHTASWWKQFLLNSGTELKNLTIEPLVWDPQSSVISLYENRWIIRMIRKLLMLYKVIKQISLDRLTQEPDPEGNHIADYALGYFIFGQKL